MAQAIIANRDAVLLENFAPIMRSNYSDAELLSTHPLRRFFHTYIVASIVAVSTAALFAVGAIAGTFSHILLDSVVHHDIRPFAPFSDSNPLLGAMPIQALHWSCVAFGFVGLFVLVVRYFRREPS